MVPAATRPARAAAAGVSSRSASSCTSARRRGRTDGLPRTAPSTAAARLEPVFEEVGPVGVARARVVVRLGVVVRALVLVLDHEADGRAERDAGLDARLDLDGVGLVALRARGRAWSAVGPSACGSRKGTHRSRECALAGAAAGHLRLDVDVREGHALRARRRGRVSTRSGTALLPPSARPGPLHPFGAPSRAHMLPSKRSAAASGGRSQVERDGGLTGGQPSMIAPTEAQ